MSEQIRRVLVVDDDPVFREFVELLLTSEGYEVRSTPALHEAISLAVASWPDVVISDVRMPGTQAFALLRQLRADPATASLPVLLCTGAVQEAESLPEQDLGDATALIYKPFDINELLDCVARLAPGG